MTKPQLHRIVIIGTGGGGLCMGMQLKRAGIDDFTTRNARL